MILKPFMLRRIKKDVENELSDKIEIMVYCPLTMRQHLLYMALKKKIRIEDLLQFTDRGSEGHSIDKSFTSNLMNLVMQFRKVCNHPDLFKRRDALSPFSLKCSAYPMARLIYENSILQTQIPSKEHLLYNRFNIFKAENVHRSVFPKDKADCTIDYKHYIDLNADSGFSFIRFCDLSPQDVENFYSGDVFWSLKGHQTFKELLKKVYHLINWADHMPQRYIFLTVSLSLRVLRFMKSIKELLFTKWASQYPFYTFAEPTYYSMAETMEHRVIRSKSKAIDIQPISDEITENVTNIDTKSKCNSDLLLEHHHIPRPPRHLHCKASTLPSFLHGFVPKVQCNSRKY